MFKASKFKRGDFLTAEALNAVAVAAAAKAQGGASYVDDTGSYQRLVKTGSYRPRLFKLTQDLVSGNSAAATEYGWTGTTYEETEQTEELWHDPLWLLSGTAYTIRTGTFCRAVVDFESGYLVVIEYAGPARWVLATAAADFSDSQETIDVNVQAYWDGANPVPEDAETNVITVDNPGWGGLEDDLLLLVYNDAAAKHRILMPKPKLQEVITAWQYDDTAGEVQAKTRPAFGFFDTDETDWEMVAEVAKDCD